MATISKNSGYMDQQSEPRQVTRARKGSHTEPSIESQHGPGKYFIALTKFVDEEAAASETNDADFSYKEVSDLSDATEDIQAESMADQEINDLDDYQTLVATTQKKL